MRFMLTVAAGAAFALAPAAFAQDTPKRQDRPKADRQRPRFDRIDEGLFDQLDVNKDGAITLDEQPEERRERVKQLIERFDANKDGKLTREEFNAAIERLRGPSEERKPADRPTTPAQSDRPTEPRKSEGDARSPQARPAGDQPPAGRTAEPGRGEQGRGEPGRPQFPAVGALFRLLDANNDGRLSSDELKKAGELLAKFDRDGDGSLSPEELAEGIRTLVGDRPPGERPPGERPTGDRPAGDTTGPRNAPARSDSKPESPDAARRPAQPPAGESEGRDAAGLFKRMDKNGDGKLSKDELPELLRERFGEFDTNKDGFVDEKEFAQAIAKMKQRRPDGGDGPPRGPFGPGGPFGDGARPSGGATDLGAAREKVAAFLREHDKDVDGRISLDEFGKDRADEFKKLDTNGDGFLTPDELARGLAPRGDARPPAEKKPDGK